MKFPLLIKFEHKKTGFLVKSLNELPVNTYFKIIKSQPKQEDYLIDLEYKVINDGVCACNPFFHTKNEEGKTFCRACGLEIPLHSDDDDISSKNDEASENIESSGEDGAGD